MSRASKAKSLQRKLVRHTQPLTTAGVRKVKRGVQVTRRDMQDTTHPMAKAVAPSMPVEPNKKLHVAPKPGYTVNEVKRIAALQRRQERQNERMMAKLIKGKSIICARCGSGHSPREPLEKISPCCEPFARMLKISPCCEPFARMLKILLGADYLEWCWPYTAPERAPMSKVWYEGQQILNAPWYQALNPIQETA